MSRHPLVVDHLAALAAELRLPRRRRARVLAEAEDHLLCIVEAQEAAGRSRIEAGQIAVRRFGVARLVAREHQRAEARRAAVRLAWLAVLPVAAFGTMLFAATQLGAVRAGLPAHAVGTGLAGTWGWIAAQVASVCAAVTVLRAWQVARDPAAPSGSLRLVVRGAVVALAAVGVALVLDLAAFTRLPAGQGQHAALIFGLWLVASAGVVGAALALLVARLRLRALERLAHEPAGADVVARLATVVPRGTPTRAAALLSAAVGLVAGLAHLVAEGPSSKGLGSTLLVLAIITALQSAVVFAAFAGLRRLLGLVPAGASAHALS